MPNWSSLRIGALVSGEGGMVIRPKLTPPGTTKPGILYLHGAGDTGTSWWSVPQRQAIMTYLANAGYVVVSSDLGGTETWDNDTAMSAISTAYTALQAMSGVTPGQIVLFGQSMGALNALGWARYNRAKVLAVIGVIPVVNLTDCHDNRGFGSLIDAAYPPSGYSEAVYGLKHNPNTMAVNGSFTNTPIQLWQGDTDTTAPPSVEAIFAAAVGASCTTISLSGGHSDTTVGEVDPAAVLSFIVAAESVTPIIPPSDPYRYWRLNITSAHTAAGLRPSNTGAIRVAGMRFLQGSTYYPTSPMTSDSAPPPLVSSASTVLSSGFEAYHAFDTDLTDASRWASTASSTLTSWLQIDLGAGNLILPTDVDIAMDASSVDYYLVNFQILASNTGAFAGEEVTFASVTGASAWPPSTYVSFALAAPP